MKKVYQRIIDPKKGDCFKCCVASLLELDYDEVPNFVEQERWFGAAIDFCKEKGYELSMKWYLNHKSQYIENPTKFCFHLPHFVKDGSIEAIHHLKGLDGLFIASVYSPGFLTTEDNPINHLHAVICDRHLNIVFDPNPNYEGILEYPYARLIGKNGIRDVFVITKITQE